MSSYSCFDWAVCVWECGRGLGGWRTCVCVCVSVGGVWVGGGGFGCAARVRVCVRVHACM